MAIIFVISPLLGAMTDRAPRRMPFLVISTIICCVFTALLARFGFWATAICFIVANIAFQAGLQFYDALLPEVSTEENRGRIGGIGVGVGYLGSYVAVGLGFALGTDDKPLLFGMHRAAFFLASPCPAFSRQGTRQPAAAADHTGRWCANPARETIAHATRRRPLSGPGPLPGGPRVLHRRHQHRDLDHGAVHHQHGRVQWDDGRSGQKPAQLILLFAITFAVMGGFGGGG